MSDLEGFMWTAAIAVLVLLGLSALLGLVVLLWQLVIW